MASEIPQELPFEQRMLQELISMGIKENDANRILNAVGYAESKAIRNPWSNPLKACAAIIGANILNIPNYRREPKTVITEHLAANGNFLALPLQTLREDFNLSPQIGQRMVNNMLTDTLSFLQGKTAPKRNPNDHIRGSTGVNSTKTAHYISRGGYKF